MKLGGERKALDSLTREASENRESSNDEPDVASAGFSEEPRSTTSAGGGWAEDLLLAGLQSLTLDAQIREVDQKIRSDLEEKVADFIDGPILSGGTTAVVAADAKTGRRLLSLSEDAKLNPASNVKLISTATALDILGAQWRYRAFAAGKTTSDKKGISGDLYLFGSYDPTLGAAGFGELAKRIAASGVERVGGDVVLTEGALYLGRPGLVELEVSVEAVEPGKPPVVEIDPELPFVHVEVAASSVAEGETDLEIESQEAERDQRGLVVLRLKGRVCGDEPWTESVEIRDRAVWTGWLLWNGLEEAGVELKGTVRRSRLSKLDEPKAARYFLPLRVASHSSIPLKELVGRINKSSNNFLADRLIMTAGAMVHGGRPSMDKGIRVMKRWLKARASIDPRRIHVDTGSGLSYQTRITGAQIVRILRTAAGHRASGLLKWPVSEETRHWGAVRPSEKRHRIDRALTGALVDSLPIARVDGTLRRRFAYVSLEGRVVAKTGTLKGTIALSGFHTLEGQTICFSIVTNGVHDYPWSSIRYRHGQLLGLLDERFKQRAERIKQLRAQAKPVLGRLAVLTSRWLNSRLIMPAPSPSFGISTMMARLVVGAATMPVGRPSTKKLAQNVKRQKTSTKR
jgi:D-alanyl-D-alanine carboxypeptidase/D-alanyl-D-alanine-endopeptidase (penicillin-binding protein 4)